MLIIKRFCLAFVLVIFFTSYSYACDFKDFVFGKSAKAIIENYNMSLYYPSGNINTEGEYRVVAVGIEQCKDFPKDFMIEFIFVDDVFVKIHISNPLDSDELLKFANKVFGDSDDIKRDLPQDKKRRMALWDQKSLEKIVIYTAGSKGENLIIESKLQAHQILLDKIKDDESQETNYKTNDSVRSKNSSGGSSDNNNSSSDDIKSNGLNKNHYNPDSLKDLQENYKKANEAWKEKNNEINKGR
jgi:hypothetical protein